ncbi:MAG TPA: SCP2 sterol-binding domain-containing protein [Acidimicrobiales bacterium]|nr:SCP2 sterol-binding domain-containing protein [Acidimicrobiales bacterium]
MAGASDTAGTVEILTQGWLDALRDAAGGLPERPGASGRMQFTVTGAPGGEVVYWLGFRDGRLVEARLGAAAAPEVEVVTPLGLAAELAGGDGDPAPAFMQGRMKVAGDQAVLLRLLAVMGTPAYGTATRAVAARTRP